DQRQEQEGEAGDRERLQRHGDSCHLGASTGAVVAGRVGVNDGSLPGSARMIDFEPLMKIGDFGSILIVFKSAGVSTIDFELLMKVRGSTVVSLGVGWINQLNAPARYDTNPATSRIELTRAAAFRIRERMTMT